MDELTRFWHDIKKKKRCPLCGENTIAAVIYGYFTNDDDLNAKLNAKQVVWGGCETEPNNPRWKCMNCGTWFHPSGKITKDQFI